MSKLKVIILATILVFSITSIVYENGALTFYGSLFYQEVVMDYAKNSTSSTASADKDQPGSGSCPENQFLFENKLLPTNITHRDRLIPRVIHFFAHSKCLPNEMAQHMEQWTSLADHSVILHDQEEMMHYLSQKRNDLFPYIPQASKCAVTHEALLDLSRFMVLYDQGGISVDIDYVPGPGFENGALLDDSENVRYQFVTEAKNADVDADAEEEDSTPPRFIASMPKHDAMHFPTLYSVANQFYQHSNQYHDATSRKIIYTSPFQESRYQGKDYHKKITKFHESWKKHHDSKEADKSMTVAKLIPDRIDGEIFTRVPLNTTLLDSVNFHDFDEENACVNLSNDSYDVDIESLLELVGSVNDNDNGSCPVNQTYVQNVYIPESIQKKGRKVPNIVHMTSKNKCLAQVYADNVNTWKFGGHSFFLHDDDAVEKLLSRDWPEFPLLGYARQCIFTGAGLADLWRYVALWAYGGLYTDIDNGVGPMFFDAANQTVIRDNVDALFEVESGNFPSQYFMAVSPRHPLAYFMVHHAIKRLVTLEQIFVPFITGPGALKSAVVQFHGGDGYPQGPNTTYTGLFNRSFTMIGSTEDAKEKNYIVRNTIAPSEHRDALKAMNMPHYFPDKNDPDRNKEEEERDKERGQFCAEHVYHQIHSSL